jgi:hypothetical protein
MYSVSLENTAFDDPMCRSQNAWTRIESEPYSNFNRSLKVFDRAGGLKSSRGLFRKVLWTERWWVWSSE